MTCDNITYLTATSVPGFSQRKRNSHKGDYGRVLLIGGSFGMSGAIALAGRAALVTGSGLVKLAVPKCALPMVAAHMPELMTVALTENRSGKISLDAFSRIMSLVEEADVVAIGPGLGRSAGLDALVMRLHREVTKPMLIDADGLNALASHSFDRMAESFAEATARGAWRILTPHPGEFARLVGEQAGFRHQASGFGTGIVRFFLKPDARCPMPETGSREQGHFEVERVVTACQFVTQLNVCPQHGNGGVILVLKGFETVVTDGEHTFVNTSGNPGMATAGSGDVLSGMIASLIGQRFSPFDAAKLGVYLHGRAADFAQEMSHIPQESIIASTLIHHIGQAIRDLNSCEHNRNG